MATCGQCGRSWRTMPGEEQDHECPRCGSLPERRPPVFEQEISDVESLLQRAEQLKQDMPTADDFPLIESAADILLRTMRRVQRDFQMEAVS
jgi:tRNA G26 N,N-dimethylase Trm1